MVFLEQNHSLHLWIGKGFSIGVILKNDTPAVASWDKSLPAGFRIQYGSTKISKLLVRAAELYPGGTAAGGKAFLSVSSPQGCKHDKFSEVQTPDIPALHTAVRERTTDSCLSFSSKGTKATKSAGHFAQSCGHMLYANRCFCHLAVRCFEQLYIYRK